MDAWISDQEGLRKILSLFYMKNNKGITYTLQFISSDQWTTLAQARVEERDYEMGILSTHSFNSGIHLTNFYKIPTMKEEVHLASDTQQ